MTGKLALSVLSETLSKWNQHKAIRMGAALAYFGIYAFAPILIIAISIAGLVYGRAATEGNIVSSISGIVGVSTAQFVQELIASASQPRAGIIAAIIGVAGTIIASASYFFQLKDALNTVWEIAPKPGYSPKDVLLNNAISFAVVLGLALLLLVSLLFTAGLGKAGSFVGRYLPGSDLARQMIDFGLTFGLVSLLFACIFKILPDIHITWKDVLPGAILTAGLFLAVQFALSFMIRVVNPGLAFGAAGALVVVLLWVNLASLILLFGAEFIRVYTIRFGSHVKPKEYAEEITVEVRTTQRILVKAGRQFQAPLLPERLHIKR
jgi:membrane protein